MSDQPNSDDSSGAERILRGRAESLWRQQQPPEPRSDEDAQRFQQELEIHQIELELQNEELCLERSKTESTLERYTELYDFAPIGFFSFAPDGTVLHVNVTGASLLRMPRAQVVGSRFGIFVAPAFWATFNDFLAAHFAGPHRGYCELRLTGSTNDPLVVRMEGTLAVSGRECHVALMDISAFKLAEETLWRQANYDCLTDLPNRRLFHYRLQQAIKKTEREAHPWQ